MSQKKSRTLQSVSDMMISLLVVGLLVGSLAAFVWFTRQDSEQVIREVDWKNIALGAQERTDLPTLGPIGLKKDWVATSARIENVGDSQVWRVGIVTPSQEFISVIVSQLEIKRLLRTYTNLELENEIARKIGEDNYFVVERDNEKVAFKTQNNITTLIYSTTSWDEIETFIKSLKAPTS